MGTPHSGTRCAMNPERYGGTTGSGEAFQKLPELDRAEFLEALQQVVLGPLQKDPSGAALLAVGDEMHSPLNRRADGLGFQEHAPTGAPAREVAQMARVGDAGKVRG